MQSHSNSLSEEERQLRRACAELDRRLRGGERDVAAKLLDGDPRLSANAEAAIELIYTECVTLEELGDCPSLDGWLHRYPQWTERLQRLWKLHEAFDEASGDLPTEVDTYHGSDSSRPTPPIIGGPQAGPGFSNQPRQLLGQYELLEEIDRGGMGVVYRARQRGLNRIVAVKSIRSAIVSQSDRNRFRLEAEAAAKLEHPNIVRVYEVGEQDGYDFLSMEFVDGGSLQRRLKEARLSTRMSAELIATLADTMQYAHDQGIIHRDLKPGNVLLSGEWGIKSGEYPFAAPPRTVKITDFGLAKRFREVGTAQTQTGAILGTPSYMSPEQADGRQADVGIHSDIYSLGAILYELLTGRPPFEAATTFQTLQWIRNRDPIPPTRLNPEVPRDLATICLKCLHKEPARRYASARELADDVRCFLEHRPILARPISLAERSWRLARRHSLIAALLAVLLLVCVVSGGLFVWQQQRVGHLVTLAATTEREVAQQQKRATAAEAEAQASFQQSRALVEQWTRLGEQLDQRPGMDQLRRQAIEQALAFYSGFLEQHGDDPQLRLATARAAIRAGVLQSELGHWEESAKNLKQAVSLFESLPADEAIDIELQSGLLHLAHAQRRLERWTDSEATYNKVIASLKQLVANHPDKDVHAIGLANALINQCVVLNHDKRWNEAEQSYGQAIHLLRQMIERRLADSDSNPKTDVAASRVASESPKVRFSPSEEIRASRDLRERLVTAEAKVLSQLAAANYLSELALCLDDLGSLLSRRNQIDDAHQAYIEGMELRQMSQKVRPHETWLGMYLARSHSHLADVAERLKRPEEALDRCRQAISLLEKLYAESPARVDYRADLGAAYAKLARMQRNSGQTADAIESYRRAITLQEQLVANAPDVNSLKRDLAISLDGLGRALFASGKEQDASDAYRRAIQVDATFALAHNNYAWLLLLATDHQLRDDAKALELARLAAEMDPNSRATQHTLGTAQFRNGLLDDAEKSLRRSMELLNGGTAHDWFYLAAIFARRGHSAEARAWYERAKAWRDSQLPRDGELRMIQEEATTALADMLQ